MTSAPFSVDCSCGQTIGVSASEAGSTVRCECGSEVAVPSLGKLRESAGKGRYESSLSDTIIRMIDSGELPTGSICAVSGKPTEDILDLEILIPRFFKSEEGDTVSRTVLMVLLGGFLGALFSMLASMGRKSTPEEIGATTIRVPILVARAYQPKARRMSQRRLFRLLQTEPIYADLLEENPHSQVTVP